ncbi:hypothetical protein P3G55_20740 [Leptospira sp. 96542]|nr:hypothetical protein [Leptospira sp. 96542]
MKDKLIFAGSVIAVIAVVTLVNSKVNIPVLGKFLPGYTPKATA